MAITADGAVQNDAPGWEALDDYADIVEDDGLLGLAWALEMEKES